MSSSPHQSWQSKNFYELLGIEKYSSKEDIKKAYRTQAKLFHPDKADPAVKDEATERFKRIKQAYDDEESRKTYDATLETKIPEVAPNDAQADSKYNKKKTMDDLIAEAVLKHNFASKITSQLDVNGVFNVQTCLANWISTIWLAPNDLANNFLFKDANSCHLPFLLVRVNHRMTIYYKDEPIENREINTGLLICPIKNQLKELKLWKDHLFESTSQWNFSAKRAIEPKAINIDNNYLRSLVLQELQMELSKLDFAAQAALLLNHGTKITNGLFVEFTINNISDDLIYLPLVLGTYKYNEEQYPLVLNGSNKTIKGSRPFSMWKSLAASAMGGLAVYFGVKNIDLLQ